MTTPILWIIIPCYNGQEVLPLTSPVFLEKLTELIQTEKISPDSKILFVNDCSKDMTWKIINDLAHKDPHFIGISQSRNYGHQSALLADLMEAKDKCDITISIDCDGQDDIHVMNKMVDEYLNGCEIVYGVRSDRTKDTWFKRYSAESYYRILNKMGANVVFNHADYRLASSKVLQAFSDFKEVNLFLRGMFPLVGFKSTSVYYERHERIAGSSHYTLGKMFALAFEGITSFSIKPLRMIVFPGVIVAFLSFIGVFWSILMYVLGRTVSGWTSMTSLICFLGGVQLVCLGVLAGAVGGCQAEVGVASAAVELMGGTPQQCLNAASTVLMNMLGLVCDPVGGLVEYPCQNRNAAGVANALIAAEMALAGIPQLIPLDEMMETMYNVGRKLPMELRETALGGCATAPSACAACKACS